MNMIESAKRPRLVGAFIRQRREAVGLSQRALGLLFAPAVTTQFISNLERGVTPLPPAHIPTLCRALQINETELLAMLEREYSAKLSGRLGKEGIPVANPDAIALSVDPRDLAFMKALYDAYRSADDKTRSAFETVCESILKLSKGPGAKSGPTHE